VFQSYATGPVTGTSDKAEVGGLAGSCNGCLWSFATGSVTGGTNSLVGGFAGDALQEVLDCYATGSVTGGDGSYVGGLDGIAGGGYGFSTSFSTGKVSGGDNSIVGGFIGLIQNNDGFQFNYWDLDTSGTSQGCSTGGCSNVFGLSDAELKSGLPSGFDPNTWAQSPSINNGYPYLIDNPPPQ
jgi:hypothetical protein